MDTQHILSRHLHFISGKGGVGKSTLSCLFALYFAKKGEKTLLVQLDAVDSHAQFLGLKSPITSNIQEVKNNLFVVNADPEECLKEYIILKTHSKTIYNILFNNSFVRSMAEFIPSLAELSMLGKIWYHATRPVDSPDYFSRIIIDCPATGHGLSLLKVAQTSYETLKVGPVASEAKQMADYLKNPDLSALHLVTIAEELPVNECLELHREITERQLVAPGFVVANSIYQLYGTQIKEHFADKNSDLADLVHKRALSEAEQQRELRRLQKTAKSSFSLELPWLPQGEINQKNRHILEKALLSQLERGEK